MQDLYLSFPDAAQAEAALFTGTGEDRQAKFMNVDTIGAIEGAEGWHVNVRLVDGEDGSALEAFRVYPVTPLRVWG